MIRLVRICNNEGCTREARRDATRCSTCISEEVSNISKINYRRVYERLQSYLIENWSRGRVTPLSGREEDE